jgi:hypothetical protein
MTKFNALLAGLSVALASVSYGQTTSQDGNTPLTAALLADAQTRASLSGQGGAGHDAGGFYLAGDNGFRLNVGGDVQFRYTYNDRGDSDNQYGFSNPLTRRRFSGNLNQNIDFVLSAGFDREGGNASLLDAYAGWSFNEASRLQFGQFRLPFLREYSVDERSQMAADRSVVSSIFGQGRSQGVQFSYDVGNLRLTGAFSDGFNTVNTDFVNPSESDFGLTARADYVIFGLRSDFTDFTADPNQPNALLAGAAVHYQDGDAASDEMFSYTADLTWKNRGWSAFAAGVGRHTEGTSNSFDDFGLEAQGAYRFSNNIEPFARYDAVFADSSRGFDNDTFNFVTVGANYYLYGNAARFTLDAVYSVDNTNGLGNLGNFNNTGLLGSGDEGEVALRAQFQLVF